MGWLQRAAAAPRSLLSGLNLPQVSVALDECPGCGVRPFLRVGRTGGGLRCTGCFGDAAALSVLEVVRQELGRLDGTDAYEMSGSGPLLRFLRRQCRTLTYSEFFADAPRAAAVDGVLNQAAERLTFSDGAFDLVTCIGLFELVRRDALAFAEVRRVLRPGGRLVFSVPLVDAPRTLERVRVEGDRDIHLLPAEYRRERRRGGRVLVYRNYGRDLVARVARAGFDGVAMTLPRRSFMGHRCIVVVAERQA